ncbi:MAG: D-glycero-beta-D-manno-heptose 1,7-bisphosphate 7-phosphatase [Planctomycetes bacterium]|nr:D-glycero-beta-D-manno-heptose 1,7-bisphosphate 7-phosphatase [Planctomycetota bacterium]
MRPAVFLDRDGTLTVESDWVTSGADLVLVPGAAEAIALLERAGFAVVVVTNQSAVARGMIDERELGAIHARFEELLAERGARLDGIYSCPHHPTEGVGAWRRECECRKPKPGLVLQAARELGLDLARSWIVGDALRDLEAGWSAGTRAVLVATGKGAREHATALAKGRAPDAFVPDVLAAARWIVAATPHRGA